MTVDVPEGEVHVWRVDLAGPRPPASTATLAPDELERAERFLDPSARRRFIRARAALRAVLSSYLDCSPAKLRFAYGPHGKPELHPGLGREWLRFNVSHAGRLALIAVARCDVGVDVEPMVPSRRTSEIAAAFFSAREKAALSALSGPEWLAAFYACWTRREALVKAIGGGMSVPLDSFDVWPQPKLPPGWTVRDLRLDRRHVAALAFRGSGALVRVLTASPRESEAAGRCAQEAVERAP